MADLDGWLTEPYEQAAVQEAEWEEAIEELVNGEFNPCDGDLCLNDDPCSDCVNQAIFDLRERAEEWRAEQSISRAEDAHLDDWGD